MAAKRIRTMFRITGGCAALYVETMGVVFLLDIVADEQKSNCWHWEVSLNSWGTPHIARGKERTWRDALRVGSRVCDKTADKMRGRRVKRSRVC